MTSIAMGNLLWYAGRLYRRGIEASWFEIVAGDLRHQLPSGDEVPYIASGVLGAIVGFAAIRRTGAVRVR